MGTESPEILNEAISWGYKYDWKIIYTNLFKRENVLAQYKYNKLYNTFIGEHHDLEYISMLLNIDISLRCNAWIHTLQSNWNRIIDELRVTVAGIYNIYNL